MDRPDYTGNNLVNLMASIGAALGVCENAHDPLDLLHPAEFAGRPVVLLVLDGLGHDLLARFPGSDLHRRLRGRLGTVFPATTASAITSIFTGVAPQQHGITGWFTYFRELGSVATVLPFQPRHGGGSYTLAGIEPQQLLGSHSLFARLPVPGAVVNPAHIADSAYSRAVGGPAERRTYTGLEALVSTVTATVGAARAPRLTIAYWPELDALAHHHGVDSPEVRAHFQELDQAFTVLVRCLADTGALLLVTADHGLIDTGPDRLIRLEDHPRLADSLTLPLCGEPRTAFCYVRARRREDFESYVRDRLGHCCELLSSEQLLEEGWFGLGPPHPRLHERIGDYALLMKENYVIRDRLPMERPFTQVGVHGGLSAGETQIPLIVAAQPAASPGRR